MKLHMLERTAIAVKNFWNRTGRARSGFDERKNKSKPLATSKQGKKAKEENRKRKASSNSAEGNNKRRKTEQNSSKQRDGRQRTLASI